MYYFELSVSVRQFGGEEYFQPRGPLKRPAYTQQRPKPGEQGAAEPECGVSASG